MPSMACAAFAATLVLQLVLLKASRPRSVCWLSSVFCRSVCWFSSVFCGVRLLVLLGVLRVRLLGPSAWCWQRSWLRVLSKYQLARLGCHAALWKETLLKGVHADHAFGTLVALVKGFASLM